MSAMILHVRSSVAAIRANSCSYGAIKWRLLGARFRLANVRAANFEIFSSTAVYAPVTIRPISLSMHRCFFAILTLRFVCRSEIVNKSSRTPSRVSKFRLTSRLTNRCN